ncbi:hypothetical protein IPL85_06195 [Candidatus Saccharibacteria bacterium]|nr:MAG: hypothetical protein IPL85_06195 [Candidatus Saccharibacteria bacterium]
MSMSRRRLQRAANEPEMITHGTVTAIPSNLTVSLSGSITTTLPVTFDGLNISVAQDTGGYPWVASTAFANGQTVNGTFNLSGSLTLSAGNFVAYVSYSIDNQATWIVGPKVQFSLPSTSPNTITNFLISSPTNTTLNLAWSYSGSALNDFTLRRNGNIIASPAAAARSYNDTGLTLGTSYSYSIVGNFSAGGTTNTATVTGSTTGGTSSLPAILAGYYVNKWNSPTLSQCFSHGATHAYAFVAQSAASGTGTLSYSPFEGDAAFIAAKQAAGKKVILTLGGANDGGIALQTGTHVTQMVNSVKSIIDRLGLDGIDWDLESSSYTVANIISVSQQLVAHYGSSFMITMVPRPWETAPFQAAQQLQQAGMLTLFGLQFYDSPEYSNYSQGWSYIQTYINKAVSTYGIPANKVIMGVTGPNYSNGGMAYSLMLQYWSSARSQWPTLRGMFFYDGPIDQADGWGWANNVLPTVLSS